MNPIFAPLVQITLLCFLTQATSAAEFPESPSGNYSLKQVERVVSSVSHEGEQPVLACLLLERRDKPVSSIVIEDGRIAALWNEAAGQVVITNQMDRANFEILIVPLEHGKAIKPDFKIVDEKIAELAPKEDEWFSLGPVQLVDVKISENTLTGKITKGHSKKTVIVGFSIDLTKLAAAPDGANLIEITQAELRQDP